MTTKGKLTNEQVLSGLQQTRHELLQAAQAVPLDGRNTVFLGTWSLCDLLAHLVGWNFANLQAIPEVLSGRIPSFYAYHDRDWVNYNAMLVAKYKCDSFEELLGRVQDSHNQLMTALRTTHFMIFIPGLLLGIFPVWLMTTDPMLFSFGLLPWLVLPLWVVGITMTICCAWAFTVRRHGNSQ
jgi:hypothetical protein